MVFYFNAILQIYDELDQYNQKEMEQFYAVPGLSLNPNTLKRLKNLPVLLEPEVLARLSLASFWQNKLSFGMMS